MGKKLIKNSDVSVSETAEFTDQKFLTELCLFDEKEVQQLINDEAFPESTIFRAFDPKSKADMISDTWICFPAFPFKLGFKYPFPALTTDFFEVTGLSFFQAMPMVWRVLWTLENLISEGGYECGVEELAYCYDVRSHGSNCYLLKTKPGMVPLILKTTKNSPKWKNNFFFVKRNSIPAGDTLPKEWITKAFQFSDSAPAVAGTAARVTALLKINPKSRTFGHTTSGEGSSDSQVSLRTMSSGSQKVSNKISYDDISSLIAGGGKKERSSPRLSKPPIAEAPKSSSPTTSIVQGSSSKKRKTTVAEDLSSTNFYDAYKKLDVIIQHLVTCYSSIEKRNQQLELIVKNNEELLKKRAAISAEHERQFKELEQVVEAMKDAQTQALEDHAQELKDLSLKHAKALDECIAGATSSTAIFLLQDRLNIMKEAKDKGADISAFDVKTWEISLARLKGEADPEAGCAANEADGREGAAEDLATDKGETAEKGNAGEREDADVEVDKGNGDTTVM